MKKKLGITSIVIILFAGLFVLLSSLVVTYKDQYKLVKQFGKVDRVIEKEGVSLKIPFVEQVDTLPSNTLLYDLAASDVITKDKKTMVTDTYVLWEIIDPLLFAQTLNSISNAENRINTVVYNSMKNTIGSMEQTEVISARDGALSSSVMDSVESTMAQYGIKMLSVETKRLDLPSDNKAAVYERMISEREQMAAQYTAEGSSESQIKKNTTDRTVAVMIAEAEAEAEKIMAEGEAEYMRVLSEAYNTQNKEEFYTFIRSLDAAKASLKGDNKTLILGSDSPIAQIFQ